MDDPKKQLIEKLKSTTNILVTVRNDPSIDELSACIGLTLLLNKYGKRATAVFSGEVPSVMDFLKPEETLEKNTDSLRDYIIALDKSKADKLRYKVEDRVVKIFITPYRTSLGQDDLEFSQGDFNVDAVVALGAHEQQELDSAITAHTRILHDAVIMSINNTESGNFGSINWVDSSASSLSELVARLNRSLSTKEKNLLDEQIATALLTGIVAETERFSNARTTPDTMSISSELMAAGANQQLVASELAAPPEEELPPEPVADENGEAGQDGQDGQGFQEGDNGDGQGGQDGDGGEGGQTLPPVPPVPKPNDGTLEIFHDESDWQPHLKPEPAPEPEYEPEPEPDQNQDQDQNQGQDQEQEQNQDQNQNQESPRLEDILPPLPTLPPLPPEGEATDAGELPGAVGSGLPPLDDLDTVDSLESLLKRPPAAPPQIRQTHGHNAMLPSVPEPERPEAQDLTSVPTPDNEKPSGISEGGPASFFTPKPLEAPQPEPHPLLSHDGPPASSDDEPVKAPGAHHAPKSKPEPKPEQKSEQKPEPAPEQADAAPQPPAPKPEPEAAKPEPPAPPKPEPAPEVPKPELKPAPAAAPQPPAPKPEPEAAKPEPPAPDAPEKSKPAPETPDVDIDSARDEVLKALEETSDQPLEPISALNAQPLGGELHPSTPPAPEEGGELQIDADGNIKLPSQPVMPDMTKEPAPSSYSPADQPLDMPLPTGLHIPPPQASPPTNQSSGTSDAPPPVPPPMMPQYTQR